VHKDEAPRLNDAIMYRIQFGASRPTANYACDFGANSVVWGPAAGVLDGTNADELSKGELRTRLAIYEDFAAKQKERPELVDARVTETPPLLGVRQTRFIEGEYKLTADDAISGRRFQDVIAISPCPIIHYYGYRRYLEHEGYDIPYRCLVPLKVENLLVAGRCISSEQPPYESHRAMVPMMAIGQAAGVAAALAVSSNTAPRKLDVRAVQSILRTQGAELRL
jgi:FAD dependent oxidoreductase